MRVVADPALARRHFIYEHRSSLFSSVLLHAAILGLAIAFASFHFRQTPAVRAIEAYVVKGPPRVSPPAVPAAELAQPVPVPVASPALSAPALPELPSVVKPVEHRAPPAAKPAPAAPDKSRAEKAREAANKLAEAKAEKRRQADAADRTAREAELDAQLAREDRRADAERSGLLARYEAEIRGRVQRAWNRPVSARPGLKCIVYVTQVPGGEVTGVRLGDCNGDAAVRQSIENAVYRASPLPAPPDSSLFERNLKLEFAPDG
jgi:outer membrane biosynthesis protein TonB